jgi:hypothetical protein
MSNFDKMIEGGAITVFNTKTKNWYSFQVKVSKSNPKNVGVKIYVEGMNSRFFRDFAWFNTDKMVLNWSKFGDQTDPLSITGMEVFSFILRNIESLQQYPHLKYKFQENHGYDYNEPRPKTSAEMPGMTF